MCHCIDDFISMSFIFFVAYWSEYEVGRLRTAEKNRIAIIKSSNLGFFLICFNVSIVVTFKRFNRNYYFLIIFPNLVGIQMLSGVFVLSNSYPLTINELILFIIIHFLGPAFSATVSNLF